MKRRIITQAPATQPSDEEDPQPPLSVQLKYLQGRLAWRQGHPFKATQHLQAALRICPKCPEILRLLGNIDMRSGNQARGARMLEKAVLYDPLDIESLMLLGRYRASEGKWAESIVTLATAQRTNAPKTDPALKPLLQYLLGNALTRQGYDQAALAQISGFLKTSMRFDRTTRLVRELALLVQKRGSIWQLAGDAHNRMNDPVRAIKAYLKALKHQPQTHDDLVRRSSIPTCGSTTRNRPKKPSWPTWIKPARTRTRSGSCGILRAITTGKPTGSSLSCKGSTTVKTARPLWRSRSRT